MDLVRKQAQLTSAKITALVFVAGSAFALRRPSGELLIRQLPKRASVRAHVSGATPRRSR